MMHTDSFGAMRLEDAAYRQTLIDIYKFGSFVLVVEVGEVFLLIT
jgi:hypothetical protein